MKQPLFSTSYAPRDGESTLDEIEKFEAGCYPIAAGTSSSMLKHLMDARDLEEADLIPVLGTLERVAEILSDQRAVDLDEARKLTKFFRVDLDLLLESD